MNEPSRKMVEPDPRILVCLGPCHGEFYLPLSLDDQIVCPNDRNHPVALYQNPSIHAGIPQSLAAALDLRPSTGSQETHAPVPPPT